MAAALDHDLRLTRPSSTRASEPRIRHPKRRLLRQRARRPPHVDLARREREARVREVEAAVPVVGVQVRRAREVVDRAAVLPGVVGRQEARGDGEGGRPARGARDVAGEEEAVLGARHVVERGRRVEAVARVERWPRAAGVDVEGLDAADPVQDRVEEGARFVGPAAVGDDRAGRGGAGEVGRRRRRREQDGLGGDVGAERAGALERIVLAGHPGVALPAAHGRGQQVGEVVVRRQRLRAERGLEVRDLGLVAAEEDRVGDADEFLLHPDARPRAVPPDDVVGLPEVGDGRRDARRRDAAPEQVRILDPREGRDGARVRAADDDPRRPGCGEVPVLQARQSRVRREVGKVGQGLFGGVEAQIGRRVVGHNVVGAGVVALAPQDRHAARRIRQRVQQAFLEPVEVEAGAVFAQGVDNDGSPVHVAAGV